MGGASRARVIPEKEKPPARLVDNYCTKIFICTVDMKTNRRVSRNMIN